MSVKLIVDNKLMTFQDVIAKLRDGHGYRFGHANLKGFFYKAPFPENVKITALDGNVSAITFWQDKKPASPVLMLYDFDDDEPVWYCERGTHPLMENE